jgi:hypothetical protein
LAREITMRFYFLATVAAFSIVSVVRADSSRSFFIEADTDTVSSYLGADGCDYLSEAVPQSSYQSEDVAVPNPLQEAAVSNEAEQIGEAFVAGEAPKESWWSYGKRMALGAADVAYQYLRANRLTGVESGSCQSWTSLTKLKDIEASWSVNSKLQFLLAKNGKSVVSTQVCDDVISEEYEWLGLKGALKKANKIQSQTNVRKVFLPLNLNLTNYVSDEKIMHRVAMEVLYNETGIATSVKILDPQLGLSGSYFSNAKELCEEAFSGLSDEINSEYVAVGIQLPGTGNCQKMAAYVATELAKGKTVNDLTIEKANAFCSDLHTANVKPSNPSIFGRVSSWFGY